MRSGLLALIVFLTLNPPRWEGNALKNHAGNIVVRFDWLFSGQMFPS